jgi:type I restriction enzyme, R subunit
MAKQFKEAARRGEEVNLNDAELAFYDALETNEASVRKLGDEILLSFLESSLAFDSNSQD